MKKSNYVWSVMVFASCWRLACSFCFFTALGLVAAAGATATIADTLDLENNPDFYRTLTSYTDAFIDDSLTMTIDDVILNPSRFRTINTKYIDLGPSSGRVWLRSKIRNAHSAPGTWRIDINRQYYQSLDVFVVYADKSISHILQSKISDSFNDRAIKDRMLGVDLTLATNQTVAIFLSFTSDTTTFVPLSVGTIDATIDLHANEHTLNWFFNGALVVLVAITLMMMPITGWRLSMSFSLYIVAGFIYIFHTDGYTFVHLWPDHMQLNDSFNMRFMVLMPLFGLVFAQALFNFKKFAPLFYRYLLVYYCVAVLVSVFAFQIYQFQPTKVIAYLVVPIGSFSQLAAAIIACRLGLQGAKPYFFGALIIIAAFLYAVLAHLVPGYFNMDTTLDFGHFALVTEGLAFAAAITARLVGLRDERDRALQAELSSANEKLALSTKLQNAQENFIRARKTADLRRTQLSNVSHDLQQPLASLRSALNRMGNSSEDTVRQMHNAFDYLERLAYEQVKPGMNELSSSLTESGVEVFPVSVVLDNVKEMFVNEAAAKGLTFRYRPSSAKIYTDPISLMRVVSNLVSNAIKHSVNGGILLAARRRGNYIRIEIWDTGIGMSEEELERCMRRHEKGDASEGNGLGLSIVNTISEQLGVKFEMYSHAGIGSVAFLYIHQDT